MSAPTARFLETFPGWLKSLGADAAELANLLGDETLPDATRRMIAGSLNYLFKSLDLIPDGIEDLGFLDDAFVLRVAAALATRGVDGVPESDSTADLRRLAADASVVQEFLGAEHPRLEAYVRALTKGAARGRTVDEIMTDPSARAALASEVHGWASSYEVPTFTRDEKTIVKLRSFLETKLPR